MAETIGVVSDVLFGPMMANASATYADHNPDLL